MSPPRSASATAALAALLLFSGGRPTAGLSAPSPPAAARACADGGRRAALLTAATRTGVAPFLSVFLPPRPAAAAAPAAPDAPAAGKESKLRSRLGVRILAICRIMDELQRDLFQGRWDLVEEFPLQLRSYVPVLTVFTDTAFPGDGSDQEMRVSMRYEVGRFFGGVQKLKLAASRKDINAAYLAYAEMALHYDLYLKAGVLYQYEEVSTAKYYREVDDYTLIYADPRKNPAFAGDLVILASGPDKGRTGTVIAVFPETQNRIVKMDRRYMNSVIREIKVVPEYWAALRLGEQSPDEVFLLPRSNPEAT